MGMFSQAQPGRRGMLDPAMMQRMAELQALLGADPSGTGMVQPPPGPSNPSFDAWSAANPVPLAYTGMPPGGPPPGAAPPMQPGMPPPGGMGMPPAGGPMATYSQQMDQGQQPPMPQMPPQIAPGAPGEAASADPFFQALAGFPSGLDGCGSKADLLPNTAAFPASPGKGDTVSPSRVSPLKARRKMAGNSGPSESDQLNAQMLAAILARKARA